MQRTGCPGGHGVTAELSRADRQRLPERLAELGGLDGLMREPGGLPSVPEPPPLYRAGRDTTTTRLVTEPTTRLVTGRTTP